LTKARFFAADKPPHLIINRPNSRFWSPLEHRSAFIGAYRRQKTLASAKPPNVGRNENANAIALAGWAVSFGIVG
jgi:hypothetical protein